MKTIPEPQTVMAKMNLWVRWAESDRNMPIDYHKDAVVELPRERACLWWLLAWCEPVPGVKFTHAERVAAGSAALAELEGQRKNRGGDEVGWWRIPANARALARLDELTRPDGPPEAA